MADVSEAPGIETPTDPRPGAPVLVVGTDDWAVDQTVERLARSGLPALTCHANGQPAFPCDALIPGRVCPLDRGCAVVVTVRARPLERPAPGEMGVVCGLHRGVALLGAGMPGGNPFEPWLAGWVAADEDVAAVVSDVLEHGAVAPAPAGERRPA